MGNCINHLDFAGGTCEDCGLEVDEWGNTEAQPFDYCTFPGCGCDGSRLCQAKSGASDRACRQNVEGMWRGKTKEQRNAVFDLYGDVLKEKREKADE